MAAKRRPRDWMKKQREEVLGLSQPEMAERFRVSVQRISAWECGSSAVRLGNQRLIAKHYELPLADVLARFRAESLEKTDGDDTALDPSPEVARFIASPTEDAMNGRTSSIPPSRELRCVDFLPWVEQRSALSFQQVYERVAGLVYEMESEHSAARTGREHAKGKVGREDIVNALGAFYGPEAPLYRVRVDGDPLRIGMLVQPENINVSTPFDMSAEQVSFIGASDPVAGDMLDGPALEAVMRRIAEVELDRTVLVDRPLYRLESFGFSKGGWNATLSESDFLSFALTNDLLEGELVDALMAGTTTQPGSLPLRDLYLPTFDSILSVQNRCCVGGVAGLMAIAREDPEDYLLLVQKRSAKVLNLAGRLSVIPRAFHQPINEPGREVFFTKTLLREIEEELLGREDLDLLGEDRRGDPLHPERATEAMRALQEPGVCRMECTGFGFNATNGNYELAALIMVEDPSWWKTFGHLVEANWESCGLQRYSSLDTLSLTALIRDARWSDGGLFEFIQGLRRLGSIAPDRVHVPLIEVTL